jgi:hypothetical protein
MNSNSNLIPIPTAIFVRLLRFLVGLALIIEISHVQFQNFIIENISKYDTRGDLRLFLRFFLTNNEIRVFDTTSLDTTQMSRLVVSKFLLECSMRKIQETSLLDLFYVMINKFIQSDPSVVIDIRRDSYTVEDYMIKPEINEKSIIMNSWGMLILTFFKNVGTLKSIDESLVQPTIGLLNELNSVIDSVICDKNIVRLSSSQSIYDPVSNVLNVSKDGKSTIQVIAPNRNTFIPFSVPVVSRYNVLSVINCTCVKGYLMNYDNNANIYGILDGTYKLIDQIVQTKRVLIQPLVRINPSTNNAKVLQTYVSYSTIQSIDFSTDFISNPTHRQFLIKNISKYDPDPVLTDLVSSKDYNLLCTFLCTQGIENSNKKYIGFFVNSVSDINMSIFSSGSFKKVSPTFNHINTIMIYFILRSVS